MAFISDVVGAVAEVEGTPEATVSLLARYAREAGHLSQGARGINAPSATVADCANILIAVGGSGRVVKDAPWAIETFRDLIPRPGPFVSRYHTELLFLERGLNFGSTLESIIALCIGGEMRDVMMREASKYLGQISELRADQKTDVEEFIEIGVVKFDVDFFLRPSIGARIIMRHVVSGANEPEIIARVHFIPQVAATMAGKFKDRSQFDGREERGFGYRTLARVAEVMRG